MQQLNTIIQATKSTARAGLIFFFSDGKYNNMANVVWLKLIPVV